MKKILITGSNGFLGSNLVKFFSLRSGYEVYSTSQNPSRDSLPKFFYQGSLLDKIFIDNIFSTVNPDLVINTVSLVNIDQCEIQPSIAYEITVQTAHNIAKAAKKTGSRLFYISTDHLFDGKKTMYTEKDPPHPVNNYGKTKLQAEDITRHNVPEAVLIRTNFFGWSPENHAQTFGEWVYTNLLQQKPMTLFTDYYFTPIEVTYLAESLEMIINSDFSGILNVVGSEKCSKYDFGIALADIAGFDAGCITPSPVLGGSFQVRRPKNLALSTEKFDRIFETNLPDLNRSLERFIQTLPARYKP